MEDSMVLIMYTTRLGARASKESSVFRMYRDIEKIKRRGGWAIKVL